MMRRLHLAPLAVLLLVVTSDVSSAQPYPTALVSTNAGDLPADHESTRPALAPDGRFVVFETLATNLVVPDAGTFRDIVIKDLQTGAVERISVNSFEIQAGNNSFDPSVSAAGRYVAFHSTAPNLVTGDNNVRDDVFMRDRAAGTTIRISVDAAGVEGTGHSSSAWITPDGRYVAFQSQSDLVPPWYPGSYNIFVRDLQANSITLESKDADLMSGAGDSRDPHLTPDGRFLAFSSSSNELVPDDDNFTIDIFVRDRALDTVERVSVDSLGVEHVGDASRPWISDDGRYVAFVTSAFLDASDNNDDRDIYVRDRQLGLTHLITPFSDGGPFESPASLEPVLSADGRWVVFQSDSYNLVAGDSNGFRDLFVHDMLHGVTRRITYGFAGDQTNEFSSWPAISPDARLVAFSAKAENLVSGDGNGKQDVFLLDIGPWGDVGSALPGVAGAPRLEGHGTLETGASCDLELSSSAPSAPCMLFVSLVSVPVPFKGGSLVAFPFIAQVVLGTDAAGGLLLPFTWPPGVPAGTHLDFQCAIQDAAAPLGASLSNALDALTP